MQIAQSLNCPYIFLLASVYLIDRGAHWSCKLWIIPSSLFTHFLASLFTKGKCVQFIIYKILPSFFIRFPPQFLILIGLHRMTLFCQRINMGLSFVAVEGMETSAIYYIIDFPGWATYDLHVQ